MKPLTIDEIKDFLHGDWLWVVDLKTKTAMYGQILVDGIIGDSDCRYLCIENRNEEIEFSTYGTKWVAYKNKELAEAKTESVVDEYINDLEAAKEHYKQESHYWYGQAHQNYEDCHNGWTEQIKKKVAQEILHDLHVRVCQAAMVLKEGTDEELRFLPTKAITDFIKCTKSHYEVEVE